MVTKSAPSSLTEWVVLALISEQESHGFSVARELARDAPLGRVWTVPRPIVYRAIDRLEGEGWLTAVRAERGDQGPQRTVMRVTPAGRRHLAEWLSSPVAHPRDVRSELMVKLTLIERFGGDPRALARAQLDAFAEIFSGLALHSRAATGSDRLVALWRFENTRAIERTLRAISIDG